MKNWKSENNRKRAAYINIASNRFAAAICEEKQRRRRNTAIGGRKENLQNMLEDNISISAFSISSISKKSEENCACSALSRSMKSWLLSNNLQRCSL